MPVEKRGNERERERERLVCRNVRPQAKRGGKKGRTWRRIGVEITGDLFVKDLMCCKKLTPSAKCKRYF